MLKALGGPTQTLVSVDAAADVLMELGENGLALAYCNQSVALTRHDPAALPHRLWRAARCYGRLGFPDTARDLLKEAIAGLDRDKPGPLRAYVLLDLGAALATAAPEDATPALVEAGEIFLAKGQHGQAATAFLNLGVIFSRAHRLDEALSNYEKARALRESDPATTPAQRGNLHNNIASVHRRRGDLAGARAEVARALEILEPVGGEFYAHALGSQGEICRDAGEPEAALTWFSRARATLEAQSDPNREKLAEALRNEAQALERLGRVAEAELMRARIAALRAEAAPPPPTEAILAQGSASSRDRTQSVVVTLDGVGLPKSVYRKYALDELEEQLESRLEETGAGELDGHERGPEHGGALSPRPRCARAVFGDPAGAARLPAVSRRRDRVARRRRGRAFELPPPTRVRTAAS